MTTIEDFVATFEEEPGYLDFAAVGPIGTVVQAESNSLAALLAGSRFGTRPLLFEQGDRVREAVGRLSGFAADQIVFQPNTSQGLMHAMFGITGAVAMSPAEFPSLTYAVTRAAESLNVVSPLWLETDHGRVTPGNLRKQLTSATTAVAVSLVDYRTGYLVDLEGIRQVIGDRLLIVDAIQGFGVADVPYELADVVVSGGQKWVRAGWGTGFMALSERAIDHLTPVWSGFVGTDDEDMPPAELLAPARSAKAFQVSNPDPIAQARFAAALEQIAEVGVATIAQTLVEKAGRVIEIADEFAIPVVSPRDASERAGIVVLEPQPDQLTVLSAALHNHGVTVTQREGRVRISPHVTTTDETFEVLHSALLSFSTATAV